tara:strand:+ start:1595 stop:2575 length:981 start_codon:yes stop_codon:yes gene_type:complete
MRRVFILAIFLFISCDNGTKVKYIPKSNGNINTVSVVMPLKYWKNDLGEVVKKVFLQEFKGLPQQEPIVNINFIPLDAFSGFARESRNVVLMQVDSVSGYYLDKNRYASPQLVFNIKAPTELEIIEEFHDKKDKIIGLIKNNELIEKRRRMSLSRMNTSELKSSLAIDLLIPSVYEVFSNNKEHKNIWIQKETKKGTINIIVQDLMVYDEISKYDLNEVIKLRDSIGKRFVPGRNLDSHMIIEKAYKPYIKRTKIKGFESIETRGTWELTNDFMAGPFVNYIIRDTINRRNLLLDGFVFSPSSLKREMIFELESIFKSIRVLNSNR